MTASRVRLSLLPAAAAAAILLPLRLEAQPDTGPKFVRPPEVLPNRNPRAPLAAVLKFTADRPVETVLTISDGTHSSRLVHGFSRSPEKGLAVAGMRPARKHTISVVIRDKSGKQAKAPNLLEYTTPPLPTAEGDFPPIRIRAPLRDKMEPGVTVVSVRRQAPGRPDNPASTRFGMILAVDAAGEPVWYYQHDARISDFERGPDGNLFICTLDYEIVEVDLLGNTAAKWHAAGRPQGAGDGIPVDTMTFHHEIDVLPNGNLVVLGTELREIPNYYTSETDANAPRKTQKVMGDQVIEFQRDGRIVWKWNAFDHLDPMRIGYETFSGYWVRRGFPDTLDWSHANNLLYDRANDCLLVSFRYQSAIVSIDRKSGQLRWILGKPDKWLEQQQKLLFRAGDNTRWFHHQHAPFPTQRGTMLVFDNGNYQTMPFEAPLPPNQTYTRAVEYRIDERARTVQQVWESETGPGPDSVVSVAMGNTEQLPKTGNILVSYGALMRAAEKEKAQTWNVAGSGGWTRIREYTHTKPARLVWEAVIEDPSMKLGWQLFCGVRWSSMTP